MNQEENHEHARLPLEKLRLEDELRLREAQLALKQKALQKRQTVSLVSIVLAAAILGLLGTALGAILLGRMNKARMASQNLSSAQPIIIEPATLNDPGLIAATGRLAEYFRKHGANSVKGTLHVKVVANMPPGFEDYISHYEAGTTYILPAYFRDTDILFKEYAHLVLLSDAMHIRLSDENSEVFDLEDGLTTYFPCSFNNHSVWGKVSAQNKSVPFDASDLNNAFTFPASIQDRSLIWGGMFWELRQRLGRDTTDTLLLRSWQSLQPSDVSNGADAAFADTLIQQDQLLHGGQHVAVIRSVFQKRKLRF